jgi:hypothetical protein
LTSKSLLRKPRVRSNACRRTLRLKPRSRNGCFRRGLHPSSEVRFSRRRRASSGTKYHNTKASRSPLSATVGSPDSNTDTASASSRFRSQTPAPPSPRLLIMKSSPHLPPYLCLFHACAETRPLAADHSTTSRRINTSIMSNQDVHSENSLPASKRRRVTRACDNCKSRKRRCNGEKPCAYCTEHRALCTYDAPYTRGKSDNVTAHVSRDVQQSPRGLSQWPHLARHSVASGNSQNQDVSRSSHSSSPWPRSSLIQPAAAVAEDDERTGAQSSRARSPIGGEGAAPPGQYLGPTSPFSVGRPSLLSADRNIPCLVFVVFHSPNVLHMWRGTMRRGGGRRSPKGLDCNAPMITYFIPSELREIHQYPMSDHRTDTE